MSGVHNMLDTIKSWFTKKPVEQAAPEAPPPPVKTAKDIATERGES